MSRGFRLTDGKKKLFIAIGVAICYNNIAIGERGNKNLKENRADGKKRKKLK